MTNLPFSVLKHLHSNFSNFYSNNDNKYEIIDSNRVPYIAKYNREILNFLSVADENGCIKLFRTYPKLILTKEIAAQKSCIYDLEWLSSNHLACGGGDQFVSVYDIQTSQRTAVLRGQTESIKSITSIPQNPFVLASGSRDGSVFVFDIRCNKYQPTVEIINELNIDAESCLFRAINTLNKAHYTETLPVNNQRSILKSKASNISTPHSPSVNHHNQNRKSSPVACVLFQNDHFLISAGVTDGLIKVWDTRKIYTSTSKKPHEPTPVYTFDYQSDSACKKGFSNLMFNGTRTHLYSNCMNHNLYESNMLTYDSRHTRVVNQALRPRVHKNFHLNNSNFIKSSISQCDNFILTGSSDFNAYIYSINQNSNLACFKKYLPVIVLKGHTNEVTTVDWNPFDPNQVVTCSDDNSIRLWNVKRELDLIETKECNVLRSEIIDEFKSVENADGENENLDFDDELLEKRDENYISGIIFNKKMYNKYRPHSTGVFDDNFFINFENKNFLRKPRIVKNQINFDEMDFEDELCLKCENINIDKVNTNYETSPTSTILSSIENDLVESKIEPNQKGFKKLKSILSDLPINILPESNDILAENQVIKSEAKINLSNVFSALCKNSNIIKPKSIKRRIVKLKKSPDSAEEGLTQQNILTNLNRTPLTSKKRNIKDDLDGKNESEFTKTPKTKKRLIMSECQTPSRSDTAHHIKTHNTPSHPNRTILDFFKVRQQQDLN
ncbi:unnamed protein product [Brachionus calyciflorus]|uniref:Denticleless n=1 Tax=Brachionus calyciflorus TaxID=104777 RepID=A0A813YC26_9BILA|nr:unnamed protein product [Brachionus calyciflorus]